MVTDTADVQDLRLATFGELDSVFDKGEPPLPGELDGVYHGRVLAVAGTDALPGPARRLLDVLYSSPLVPWRGKRFDAAESGARVGANVWLTPLGPNFVGYRCYLEDERCVLDYDVAENPPPLRRIRGEMVRVAPGLYLGRMGLRLGDRTPTLLYFTLDND